MIAQKAQFPLGLIAGGMENGVVNIWDPAKVITSDGVSSSQIGQVQRHQGPVKGLEFNPHPDNSHLLASGAADNEVYIMALERKLKGSF